MNATTNAPKLKKVTSWNEWLALWNSNPESYELRKALVYDALQKKFADIGYGHDRFDRQRIDSSIVPDYLNRVSFLLAVADQKGKVGLEKELAEHARAALITRFFAGPQNGSHTLASYARIEEHDNLLEALVRWFEYDSAEGSPFPLNMSFGRPGMADEETSKHQGHYYETMLTFLVGLCQSVVCKVRAFNSDELEAQRSRLIRSLFIVDPSKVLDREWCLWMDKDIMRDLVRFMIERIGQNWEHQPLGLIAKHARTNHNCSKYAPNHYEALVILQARAGMLI
jgi:hypothetical protein